MAKDTLRVGFIGWRGMVGSVLLDRLREENDFAAIEPSFFSTSQAGQAGPAESDGAPLLDAHDIEALSSLPVLLSCQGGDYTKKVYPELRKAGWNGYWIDAASALRLDDEAVLILDPVNREVIDDGVRSGKKAFIGSNCSVSLLLMGACGLLRNDLVEYISTMTYQSASGAGAQNVRELLAQWEVLAAKSQVENSVKDISVAELCRRMTEEQRSERMPIDLFGAPLAGNLLPWIDREYEDGMTREEWKGMVETNKILGSESPIPVDGLCVRVGALRCHSQAVTFKLKKDIPLPEVTEIIASGNDWVRVVENSKEATLQHLTPSAVSGSLQIAVGRVRKMKLGPEFLTFFTVGDQLLWGAAEPLRRMLHILREHGISE